jgi:hypothetical protein
MKDMLSKQFKLNTFFKGLFLMLTLSISMNSCVHELPQPNPESGGGGTTPPPVTPPTVTCSSDTVYFAQAILPLVTSLCGKSGCHGPVSHHEFQIVYASASTSYSAIKSRFVSSSSPTSYSKLNSALSDMAGQRVTGYVAPTTQQLTTLKTWISQGSKMNSCTGCDTTQFAFAANISPIISTYCAGCHPSPGSGTIPNLTTITAIQSELNNFPGRLLESVQWVAPYNTASTKMPQNGAKLPDCYITQIEKWINAGALNN